jgi:hypothetical protein
MQAQLVFELHGECAEHDTGDEYRYGDGFAVGHRASRRFDCHPPCLTHNQIVANGACNLKA